MRQWDTARPMVLEERCTGCGDCVEICVSGLLELRQGRVVLVSPEDCAYCGDCEVYCSEGAIVLPFEIVYAESAERAEGAERSAESAEQAEGADRSAEHVFGGKNADDGSPTDCTD